MEPTHFLSNQGRQKTNRKPGRDEIDDFYDQHGRDFLVALPRLPARLKNTWKRVAKRREHPAAFAPEAPRG